MSLLRYDVEKSCLATGTGDCCPTRYTACLYKQLGCTDFVTAEHVNVKCFARRACRGLYLLYELKGKPQANGLFSRTQAVLSNLFMSTESDCNAPA